MKLVVDTEGQLVKYMYDYDLEMQPEQTIEIKRMDNDADTQDSEEQQTG